MDIFQMRDYFDILQDKYGSPYYTDSEKEAFINRGQLDSVVDLLPVDGGTLNIELNQNTINKIHPLLWTIPGISMTTPNGTVNRADLDSQLQTLTGVFSPGVLRVLAIGWNETLPVKYTRKNNWYMYINNVFKAPSATNPRCYEDANTWTFRPVDATAQLSFMVVKYPVSVSLTTPVNCELPDLMHNEIISRALEYAGVGSRDQMLSELKQLNKV